MEFREREGISFEEAERRHAELERRYEAGQIDAEQFDIERQGLVVVDDEGRWWAISREGGRWLYHDSGAWIEAMSPSGSLASPGPSPDGEGVTLEKVSPRDPPERAAEHDPDYPAQRRVLEEEEEEEGRRGADPQERHCPGCSAPVGSKASFCLSCGEYLVPQEEEEGAPHLSGTTPGEIPLASPPGHPPEGDAGRENKAPLLVALGVAGLVMVLPAVAGLLVYFLWPGEAPALEGRTLAAARQQVGEDFGLVSTEEESEAPIGTIVSQDPGPGEWARWDSTISVVTSAGLPVPDLVGQPESAAEAYAGDDFAMDVSSAEESDEPIGTVLSQDPAPGEQATQGSDLSVVTSAGLPVPDLVEQTQNAAESEVGDDFEIQASSARVSSEPEGIILSQDPAPGERATQRSTISVVMSAGQPSNPGDIFADDFSDASSGWLRVSDERFANDYVDGGYRTISNLPFSGSNPLITAAGTIEDAVVEVDATRTGDTPNKPGEWGVSCRMVERDGLANGYSMGITNDGSSVIIKHKDGRLSFLAIGDANDAVRTEVGATHHIRGDCVGSKLTLYVNDQKLLEAEDAEFESGLVGLNVTNFAAKPSGTEVTFDDFLVSTP